MAPAANNLHHAGVEYGNNLYHAGVEYGVAENLHRGKQIQHGALLPTLHYTVT